MTKGKNSKKKRLFDTIDPYTFPRPGENPLRGAYVIVDDKATPHEYYRELIKRSNDPDYLYLSNRSRCRIRARDGGVLFDETVDVMRLLKSRGRDYLVTNKGVHVPLENELQGKYVMIYCFALPVVSGSSDAVSCHALLALAKELSANKGSLPDCKFVLVIILERPYTTRQQQEVAFNHFFSGFPDDFLAIPFEDLESRESVFTYLNSSGCVTLDPHGKILPYTSGDLTEYGAAFHPFFYNFDDEIFKEENLLKARLDCFSYFNYPLTRYEHVPRCVFDNKNDRFGIRHLTRVTLAEVFKCNGEDQVLAKIHAPDNIERASVSALDGKLVGLYLCEDGFLMRSLKEFQEKCEVLRSSNNLCPQLEVVVVPIALYDHPSSYFHHLQVALAHHKITSWWTLFPYNDKVTRRLWRIGGSIPMDKLILLPYDDTISGQTFSGEIDAEGVLSCLGFYDPPLWVKSIDTPKIIYPCTRERLYHERIYALEQITLTSLLVKSNQVVPFKGGDPTPVEKLQGKYVLLYLDSSESLDLVQNSCNEMLGNYLMVEREYRECQVVCIFSGLDPAATDDTYFSQLPHTWSRVLHPKEAEESIRNTIFFGSEFKKNHCTYLVFSFGEDGHLLSRDPFPVDDRDPVPYVFSSEQLRHEILCQVTNEVEFRLDHWR